MLKSFRGGSLSAIVAFTDGVVTNGDDLPRAGREAARSNVPLYLVGLGDSYDPPDLALSDLKADDVVLKGDQLLFDARLTARGPNPPTAVPVILSERQGEKLIERGREFWWDELERIVIGYSGDTLRFGETRIDLGPVAAVDCDWAPGTAARTPRQRTFKHIWSQLSTRPPRAIDDAMADDARHPEG